MIFNKLINKLRLKDDEKVDSVEGAVVSEFYDKKNVFPDIHDSAKLVDTRNAQTLYFNRGKMYKIYPSDKSSWYDAKFLVSDGEIYNLDDEQEIKNIPIPDFYRFPPDWDKYGVTGSLDYVLRMKAGNLFSKGKRAEGSACLWKATKMMAANKCIGWRKQDYYRLVYYHYENGMFEEAAKAKNYLNTLRICTENEHDLIAERRKEQAFSIAEQCSLDLVVYDDQGTGCCEECAKMRGRVYSISGKSKLFPKLPEYAKIHGNFHSGCHCVMSAYGGNVKIFHKGELVDAKTVSNRPWIDDRSEHEKDIYQHILQKEKKQEEDFAKREEWSKKKGIDLLEYEAIQKLSLPNIPKSLTGYRRMKTTKSKNFLNICNEAQKHGIKIEL